jgi:hypothetical protein
MWYTAPLATKAPTLDLLLLKKLSDYKSIDETVSQVSLKKLKGHLWYLTPEAAAMAF